MCGVAAGACGGAIDLYWATGNGDISEVNAKFSAQVGPSLVPRWFGHYNNLLNALVGSTLRRYLNLQFGVFTFC